MIKRECRRVCWAADKETGSSERWSRRCNCSIDAFLSLSKNLFNLRQRQFNPQPSAHAYALECTTPSRRTAGAQTIKAAFYQFFILS
jgi:hypothetical protein